MGWPEGVNVYIMAREEGLMRRMARRGNALGSIGQPFKREGLMYRRIG